MSQPELNFYTLDKMTKEGLCIHLYIRKIRVLITIKI